MEIIKHKTEQEEFWAGTFGDQYIERRPLKKLLSASIAFLAKALSKTKKINSVLEFGPNIGANLFALKQLIPNLELTGVEINKNAATVLEKAENINVINESMLEFSPQKKYDLVLSKTLLIHINPSHLPKAYDVIYNSCKKYILLAEYYNPTPVKVTYRNHEDRLFKRDFAGEMLNKFPDLSLVDYGFVYHRDNFAIPDDFNWFLLEKNNR